MELSLWENGTAMVTGEVREETGEKGESLVGRYGVSRLERRRRCSMSKSNQDLFLWNRYTRGHRSRST